MKALGHAVSVGLEAEINHVMKSQTKETNRTKMHLASISGATPAGWASALNALDTCLAPTSLLKPPGTQPAQRPRSVQRKDLVEKARKLWGAGLPAGYTVFPAMFFLSLFQR